MRFQMTKILFQKRFVILWWFFGLCGLGVLMMYFFPAFKSGNIVSSFSSLPPPVQKLIGDTTSWTTISGYISQQIFSLRVPLLVIILSIYIFSNLTSVDERKGITETSLALNNSRSKILINKILAAFVIIIIGIIAIDLGILLGLHLIHYTFSYHQLLILSLNSFLICLDFGLISLVFGSLSGRAGLTIGVPSVFAFLSYLLTTMVGTVESLKTVEKLSLFHYYSTGLTINKKYILILVIFGFFALIISLIGFNRRDIRTN